MSAENESVAPLTQTWWASADFPPRMGCVVEPLVDGRTTMLALCVAFLRATKYILLAGWDLDADLPLVRGADARLGDETDFDQLELKGRLQREGLDIEALAFWSAGHLRVADVLGFAASRDVRVGVLLWDAYHFGSHLTNDPTKQVERLRAFGVDCLLDDSSRRITHIVQSLHQKCAVIDDHVAFVGGIDLTVQSGGDYDRWDTHVHPTDSEERTSSLAAAAHPWHDVHTRLFGPVVDDVKTNIVQRWSEVAARNGGPTWPSEMMDRTTAALHGGVPAQIVRTIPPNTYAFAQGGIATIKETYLRAIRHAQTYVYLENQYLWPEIFVGLDTLRWGERSDDMMEILDVMRDALQRGVHIAFTLPDHPNCGRNFTDGGIMHLRATLTTQGGSDRLHVFTLGNSGSRSGATADGPHYRPVYSHAKVAIVDDAWWMAGSANLNSRGMRSDAEINVAVLDGRAARRLRIGLWAEHLQSPPNQIDALDDPLEGLTLLELVARENAERIRAGSQLMGHLLPYLTARDALTTHFTVHHEHGWLDALPGGAGAFADDTADRYL